MQGDQLTKDEARVDSYFRMKYNKSIHEMEISDVSGYWRDREPGYYPHHPLAGCLGESATFRATYTFLDGGTGRDARGRFVSPYATWRRIYEATYGK